MMQHVDITISGLVQGVFFRHFTKKTAEKLHVTGSVMNGDDGSVQIEAEGEESALKDFIAWCRQGPPGATVARVDVLYSSSIKIFTAFEIRY